MPASAKNGVLLFKTETTYGTDPTPSAGSNAILTMEGAALSEAGKRLYERRVIDGSLAPRQAVYGGMLVQLAVSCEIKGSGAAGTAPEIGPLLQACGLGETVVASTSVTYTPVNTGHKSATMYYYESGVFKYVITGVRGDLELVMKAGDIAVANFTFQGKYADPTDVSIPSPTYNSQVPKAVVGMAISVNGVTDIAVPSWSLKFNNSVGANDDVKASDGYGEILIRDRDPIITIDMETPSVATLALEALRGAGTRFAFQSGTLGSTAGNRVAVTTPSSSTYVKGVGHSAINNISGRSIEMGLDSGVGQPSIVFT